ncbi:hypothetical protein QE438_001321 [Pseudoxanthomonas sp. SORGH_AS 997]|nr:hypothetical protein [Pseudoxanthomonas sp. SORGH_AS_0997]
MIDTTGRPRGVLGRQHAALRGEGHRRLDLPGVHDLFDRLAQAATGRGQQARIDLDRVVARGLHRGEAQDPGVLIQHPAAADHRALVVADVDQLVEVLRLDQWLAEFQRDGDLALVLVGIGVDQPEAGDGPGLLRLHCFAGHRRQIAGLVAIAAGQGEQRESAREQDRSPGAARRSRPDRGRRVLRGGTLRRQRAVTLDTLHATPVPSAGFAREYRGRGWRLEGPPWAFWAMGRKGLPGKPHRRHGGSHL